MYPAYHAERRIKLKNYILEGTKLPAAVCVLIYAYFGHPLCMDTEQLLATKQQMYANLRERISRLIVRGDLRGEIMVRTCVTTIPRPFTNRDMYLNRLYYFVTDETKTYVSTWNQEAYANWLYVLEAAQLSAEQALDRRIARRR